MCPIFIWEGTRSILAAAHCFPAGLPGRSFTVRVGASYHIWAYRNMPIRYIDGDAWGDEQLVRRSRQLDVSLLLDIVRSHPGVAADVVQSWPVKD